VLAAVRKRLYSAVRWRFWITGKDFGATNGKGREAALDIGFDDVADDDRRRYSAALFGDDQNGSSGSKTGGGWSCTSWSRQACCT
jgi:hypothetical protein